MFVLVSFVVIVRLDVADLYGARADRLVLLVVDALRADQVMGEQRRQHMPYVDELHVQAHACTYPARAHTPTVTLPRIKVSPFTSPYLTRNPRGYPLFLFEIGKQCFLCLRFY